MTGTETLRSVQPDRVDDPWLCWTVHDTLEEADDTDEYIGVREDIIVEVRP